jgi:hypothetical protein
VSVSGCWDHEVLCDWCLASQECRFWVQEGEEHYVMKISVYNNMGPGKCVRLHCAINNVIKPLHF